MNIYENWKTQATPKMYCSKVARDGPDIEGHFFHGLVVYPITHSLLDVSDSLLRFLSASFQNPDDVRAYSTPIPACTA